MNTLRLGIIGCGEITVGAHLPAVASLPRLVQLVAVADVREEVAKSVGAEFGVTGYGDYRQVLEREDVDMVLIATPDALHREHVEAAAAAGKHVLCEKPMAPTVADADAMIAACDAANVKLMIAHSRRSTERYRAIARAVEDGSVGDVMLMRENERRPRDFSYWDPKHWTGDPALSRGAIVTMGIHEMDLFNWYVGSSPVRVYAEASVTRKDGVVADFYSAVVTFANGALASTEISNSLPPGYHAYHQVELYGSKGMIRVRDTDQQGVTVSRPGATTFPGSADRLLKVRDAYAVQLAGFAAAVLEDAPVPLAPTSARRALRIGLAAAESAATGVPVDLPNDASEPPEVER